MNMNSLVGILLLPFLSIAYARCSRGCNALASYYIREGNELKSISSLVQSPVPTLLSYNPQITNPDIIIAGQRLNVPFSCECLAGGDYLGHSFKFTTRPVVTYTSIAQEYSNLTTPQLLQASNPYPPTNIPDTGVNLNVPVNCSCGDRDVSPDFGLFITYPLVAGETLAGVASSHNFSVDLVRGYNPTASNLSVGDVIFIPGKDQDGNYPPLVSSKRGLSAGAIAGIVIGGIVGTFVLAGCLYVALQRKKNAQKIQMLNAQKIQMLSSSHEDQSQRIGNMNGASAPITGITVDKSVEFSYEELAKATNNFSIANKIGEGGFGAVYYAELRGENAAIKKMDMQCGKEFLAELRVLTRVHHLNLVRLIGFCVEGSLFLVYEYIENGNLSQHLRSSGRDPLPWPTRVQIALDSARGLEYIHEHTVPMYIHRDIKPANILIDKNFHGKVADFGLTKLTDVGSNSMPTGRLQGTFGYMPPEYAQYGDVSPKVDVYAFGVVLYELISAKEAIVKDGSSATDSRGLVALFDEALSKTDPSDELTKLIDPRLGNNYPLDSVQKMAQLAKVCTQEDPNLRPTMRSIVVALMTLSSTTEDWDVGNFYGNQNLLNLVSGR